MKSFLVITLALLVTVTLATAQNKFVKTNSIKKVDKNTLKEDAFALAVFKALQRNSVDGWIALHPTNEEYKGILQMGLAAKAAGLTQQVIDEIIVRRKKEAAAVYATQYAHHYGAADSLGFDWQHAVFEKWKFTEVYPAPVKLKYLDAIIWFSCNKKHFVIDGVQAVEVASGYKLQALSGIRAAEVEE